MPALIDVVGVPLMRGAVFDDPDDLTWMENAGNDAVTLPSFTLITMLEYVPTWLLVGEPES